MHLHYIAHFKSSNKRRICHFDTIIHVNAWKVTWPFKAGTQGAWKVIWPLEAKTWSRIFCQTHLLSRLSLCADRSEDPAHCTFSNWAESWQRTLAYNVWSISPFTLYEYIRYEIFYIRVTRRMFDVFFFSIIRLWNIQHPFFVYKIAIKKCCCSRFFLSGFHMKMNYYWKKMTFSVILFKGNN